MAASYHVRSSSLPARLHPHGLNQIQQLLNKLRADDNNSLSLLSNLYDSVSHLFNDSPSSLLVPHHSFFTHLLDLSLLHLDLCSKLRDITCRIKDCLRDLRSAFRRRRHSGDSTIRCHVKAFIRSRKAVHKDIAKLLLLLKQTGLSSSESSHPLITLLQQVCSQTCQTFRTVLLSLSTAVPKPRPSKWALVTKLVIKNVTSTSGQVRTGHRNEFQMMDEELRRFSMAEEIKKDRIKSMITNLDKVDVAVEDLEESLERLYRRMIQARVSLLNILSLHI
ncbi:putative protein [Arabidopsis thaliana]|uniref:At3g51400 n=1 Tax=Arabidopsis thaliana TaxID=3702 RepID=Q9SD09_ARATH|nr:hypothetical protein (DUF241) [Arabidopsis thaliana]ABF82623.1 At3g51400 [Arabidopsis thaliana]AEE78788.1 hypothetical protein (DUF241) [Arabidopsis thaliana]CAB63004.1 putative protein [Arabidopsis thaliana]|eukprot:NP_190708.1 hypothetical protein (DUF241) [Arabidopsis thaliana]